MDVLDRLVHYAHACVAPIKQITMRTLSNYLCAHYIQCSTVISVCAQCVATGQSNSASCMLINSSGCSATGDRANHDSSTASISAAYQGAHAPTTASQCVTSAYA
eukprot:7595-Heterococcus_DN1.PRE.3